jgi:hypothetical protein
MKKLIAFILTLGFLFAPTALAGTGEEKVSQTDQRGIHCQFAADKKLPGREDARSGDKQQELRAAQVR